MHSFARLTAVLVIFFSVLWLLSRSAYADFYRYTDRAGTVVITDKYASIPAEYRKKVTVIKDQKSLQEKSVPATSDTGAQIEPEGQKAVESVGDGGWQKKYLPLVVVAGILLGGFFLIRGVASALGAERLGTLIFLAVCAGGAIYLYRLYGEEMVTTFHTLRENALNVKKNVETRSEKTNNSLGDLREPPGASTTSQGK